MTDAPRPSPVPPRDSAPLASEKTPSHFPVTAQYVQRKLAEQGLGKPRIPPKLTPWLFAGFVLSGAVTSVIMGDPDVPKWLVKAAAIGSLFFGGMLGISTGWRK